MSLQNIGGFLKRVSRGGARAALPAVMHPAREWLFGIAIAALFLIAGVLFAGFFFWQELSTEYETPPASAEVIRFNDELVNDVLERYRDRAARFMELRGTAIMPPAAPEAESVNSASDESLSAE